MDRRRVWVIVLTATALAAALAVAACGSTASAGSGSFGSGGASHALQGTTASGGSYELTAASGRPTVVNFFASWCGPCNNEAPDLAAFAAAHPDVQMVGVAVNDQQPDTAAFLTKYGLKYPVVMDPNGTISAAWGVVPIPHTFFLDGSGKERASIVGSATRAQFEQDLKTIQ